MTRCAQEIENPSPTTPAGGPPQTPIRTSRAGRWRAAVLIAVHVLIAIHVGHWLATGSTMTPLEPSEAMEFSKKSIVNAGAVLFALATLSTLVLGRWFCGWACHMVALQDLMRWLLLKVGVRPKPVRMGLLAAVPWLAFVYMFLAPLVQRTLLGHDLTEAQTHFETEKFWQTFPGLFTGTLTFLICGFGIVYLLGAKGFCTYACPYGGIFGLVDQFAPIRIRVTDACQGCGHCTATCSSNVRVHQEVRDFGAVVDAGCMKCLDCVSVCPNDALYVGFGAPALTTSARRATKPKQAAPGAARRALLGTLVLSAFVVAALAVMMEYDSPLDMRLLFVLSALCLSVAVFFHGKSDNPSAYTWWEEALLGGAFLTAMWSLRGLHGAIPLLFALGLSSMLAYLVVQAVRLLYRPNVLLQRFQLRRAGRLTAQGVVFGACLLPVLGLWGHGAWTRFSTERDTREAVEAYTDGVEHGSAGEFDAAIVSFGRAVELRPGYVEARENLAGMLCAAGRFEEGIAEYQAALELRPDDPNTCMLIARAYAALGERDKADEWELKGLEMQWR